jgi:hypothetical protein
LVSCQEDVRLPPFVTEWILTSVHIAPTDILNHEVLATQTLKPKEFAMQIDLREPNMWGIVKHVVEHVQQQEVL